MRILAALMGLMSVASAAQLFDFSEDKQSFQELAANELYKDDVLTISRPEANTNDLSPAPGSLDASLKVSSLNNIAQLALPLVANEVFTNKTFEVGYEAEGFLKVYHLRVNSIHTESVDGFAVKSIAFKNNTDTLVVKLGGVDAKVTVDGNLTALWLIPVTLNAVNVTNFTAEVELTSVKGKDGVHWELSAVSQFSVQNATFHLEQAIWQKIIDQGHSLVMKGIQMGLNQLSSVVSKYCDKLNAMIANEGQYTFVTTIIGNWAPLNLTMTKAPEFSHADDMINIEFDGRFLDALTNKTMVPESTQWPARHPQGTKEQFFLHQSMVSSLLVDLSEHFLPLELKNEKVTKNLFLLFHEIKTYYGPNVEVVASAKISTKDSVNPIKFDKKDGVKVGMGEDSDLMIDLVIKCTNETATNETAMELQAYVEADINVTLSEFVIYGQINNLTMSGAKITQDNVGLRKQDLDRVMNTIFKAAVDTLNAPFAAGFDLKKKIQTLAFVNGLAQNTTVTPFTDQEFLYAGFSWNTDK